MEKLIEGFETAITGEVFLLMLVMGSFLVGIKIYQRTKISLLQPLLTAVIIIIPFLKIANIEYTTFYSSTRILNFMLGPSVVALGYVLYSQIAYLRGNVKSILVAVFTGSIVGIASVVGIAKLLGADKLLIASNSKLLTPSWGLGDFFLGVPLGILGSGYPLLYCRNTAARRCYPSRIATSSGCGLFS
jgi:hypothetical protein